MSRKPLTPAERARLQQLIHEVLVDRQDQDLTSPGARVDVTEDCARAVESWLVTELFLVEPDTIIHEEP